MNDFRLFSRWSLYLALGLIFLLTAVMAFVYLSVNDAALDQDLITWKNIGVGYLENEQPAESLQAFQSIIDKDPTLLLGKRNLAVARLMQFQQIDPLQQSEESNLVYKAASNAWRDLNQAEPQSPAAYVLAARLESARQQWADAVDFMSNAAELAPKEASIWFELYLMSRNLEQGPQLERGRDALVTAYKLAPDNLAILLEHLDAQAIAKDPHILETLELAKLHLAPLEESVQQQVHVSLSELIESAIVALRADDATHAWRTVRTIINVCRPDSAVQSDRAKVDRNLLEFALVDFTPDFYVQRDIKRSAAAPAIPVNFVAGATLSPQLGPLHEVCSFDFDLDGALDLVVLSERGVSVFVRSPQSSEWSLLLQQQTPPGYSHLLAADLDADASFGEGEGSLRHTADIDLVLYGASGVLVLKNTLDGQQRTLQTVVQGNELENMHPVTAGALGDFDHDGDLDLFIAGQNRFNVWSNRSNLQFVPWPASAIDDAEHAVSQAIPVDWDRDTDLDLLIAPTGSGQPAILENLRHGRMRWRTLDADLAAPGSRFAVLDADSNASWDLLSIGEATTISFTRTTAAGRVVALRKQEVTAPLSQMLELIDYDNDGLEDLLLGTDEQPVLLRNMGDGDFEPTDLLASVEPGVTSATSTDYDGDGDLDLVIVDGEVVRLMENQGGNANAWINVTLLAQQVKSGQASASGRVNQYGLGSLLELKSGPRYQAQTVKSSQTHFGLGQYISPDVLRVVWSNGVPGNHLQPTPNTLIYERQSLKGSCPYLYTWNGQRFEFVTDLLWAAPIGLQTSEGTLAPTREWEWLKISGDQLQMEDNEYRLQITEELWEAAYFDQVELFAVDHPADIEIYTNEKVGSPEMARPLLHTVRTPRIPLTAVDGSGRDIRASLKAIDDQYARTFEQKLYQGYTSPNVIELDLGALRGAERIMLFLTGWVYPADTSLNTQIYENLELSGPRPPYLLTRDKEQNWVETIPFLGFPGGKTKTIAIDVSDVFQDGDYRLRIATTMEIYWDAAFFTVDEEPAPAHEKPLALLSANLRQRGVSAAIIHPGDGHERYDYDQVETAPAWPPMRGRFTRYGDVTELVRHGDDQMVIMASGDAMELCFAPPPEPLPEGWIRDFVIHNVGYDKDADLNTVYGETVEPLPYQSMSTYPPPKGAERERSPEYLRYLKIYQTRNTTDASFRNGILQARSLNAK